MSNEILRESAYLVRQALGGELEAIRLERTVFGLFFTGVKLGGGHGGLCFTPMKELPEAVCCPSSAKAMPLSGKLAGRSAADCLEDLAHPNILRRTLAIAALNALSQAVWAWRPPEGYEIRRGVDAFDEVEIPIGGRTVVVGALVPMLKKLLAAGADFTVLEQDTRTLKGAELEHYAPAEQADRYLPSADLLVITGVTVLGGIAVTDADALLDTISEAGSGYHFFGRSADRVVIRRG